MLVLAHLGQKEAVEPPSLRAGYTEGAGTEARRVCSKKTRTLYHVTSVLLQPCYKVIKCRFRSTGNPVALSGPLPWAALDEAVHAFVEGQLPFKVP